MSKRMIEVESCFECPYKYWNEKHKTSECSRKNHKVIYSIEEIQVWCPLSKIPVWKLTEKN